MRHNDSALKPQKSQTAASSQYAPTKVLQNQSHRAHYPPYSRFSAKDLAHFLSHYSDRHTPFVHHCRWHIATDAPCNDSREQSRCYAKRKRCNKRRHAELQLATTWNGQANLHEACGISHATKHQFHLWLSNVSLPHTRRQSATQAFHASQHYPAMPKRYLFFGSSY